MSPCCSFVVRAENVVRRKIARAPEAPWADLEEEPGSNLISEGEKYKYLRSVTAIIIRLFFPGCIYERWPSKSVTLFF